MDFAYNVEERRLATSVKKFDAQTTVEVIVHEDGTVFPKFIYKLETKEVESRRTVKRGSHSTLI